MNKIQNLFLVEPVSDSVQGFSNYKQIHSRRSFDHFDFLFEIWNFLIQILQKCIAKDPLGAKALFETTQSPVGVHIHRKNPKIKITEIIAD